MLYKLLITLALSGYMLSASYKVMTVYQEKAEMQQRQNLAIVSLKDAWSALAPIQSQWEASFQLDKSVNDLNDVYNAFKIESYNLSPQTLGLRDSGRDEIKFSDRSIGLSKSCLANTSEGFSLKEATVSEYVPALNDFLKRPDVSFTKLTMLVSAQLDQSTPYIFFDELCVNLRGTDAFQGASL